MQSVQEFIDQYYIDNKNHLDNYYPGITSTRLLFEFSKLHHIHKNEIYLGHGCKFFHNLEKGKPLEYIQRNAYFYRSNFYVDERVLIPRSETEILVGDALNFVTKNYHKNFKIAEVGIGSFIIGLSLLMDLDDPVSLWGGDICPDAIEVAKVNRFRLKSRIHEKSSVKISLSDRLNNLNHKVDLIISNPPYIKEVEGQPGVHVQANDFEPHLALYLPDNEYNEWFDSFLKDSSIKLNNGGAFLMEGHEDCLLHLKEIAMKYFNTVEIKKDYTGRDRFLYAYI